MAQRQVNVRIDDADLKVLVAGAFVEDTVMLDEVRLAIQRRVAEFRADPDVAEVLRVQEARRTKDRQPNVTPLDSKRTRSREGNA